MPNCSAVLVIPEGELHDTSVPEMKQQIHKEMDFLRQEKLEYQLEYQKMSEAARRVSLDLTLIEENDEKCSFYTGLRWDIFEQIFKFLEPSITSTRKPKFLKKTIDNHSR